MREQTGIGIALSPRGRAAQVIEGERRKIIREAIAHKLEVELGMGAFDEAGGAIDRSDIIYIEAVVSDLIRQLRRP